MRLVLLAVLVVQDLQALPVHGGQMRDHADAPLNRCDYLILLWVQRVTGGV